ncbi:hypothetical protein ACFE04_018055 [Oxalis oulophora]
MSVRYLKKVLKEQEEQFQHSNEIDEEGEEDEEEAEQQSKPFVNPFDLLDDHQDDDEESEIVDDTSKVSIEDDDRLPPLQSKSNNHKSKKNKKKKKNKDGSSLVAADKADKSFDLDFDSLSLEGNSSAGHSNEKTENGKVERRNDVKHDLTSVLQVDPKYLNVENELRRIFGSKVVKSFEKSNPSAAGTSRQVRGGSRATHYIRKTNLVSPSEHWPRWDGSFSMEFMETKNGRHYFRYVHSSSYGQGQRAFEAAKAIHDLNGIASILMYHHYHLDSLLTMAEYFKFAGEHQMAADAVAKSLYALECAWHPMFTPFQANCQLKFSEETNKPLFTALFAHMRNLDRRGCHRSALEVCKLLLSLDSDDPMGALFCVDYYALRAEEYQWLEKFSEDYKTDNSLWLFPNFSYSLSICRLYLETDESKNLDSTKSSSTDLMKQALMLYPPVVKKLVAKVPLKDQVWTRILQNSIFRSDQTKIPSLDHLINIYVERSYLIWRLPDVQKLLRDSALAVIEALEHCKDEAKDWACVRKETFSSEKNEYGHLSVQDFSDAVPTLPPDNLQEFMVNPRMREGGVLIGDQNVNPLQGGGNIPAPRNVANRNQLAVLLESMLPWVHYGDGHVGEADEDHNGPGHRE